MSVTGKTLGVVLIGLVGLLVYLAIYVGSAMNVGIAHMAVYVGLALTAVMMITVSILAGGKED